MLVLRLLLILTALGLAVTGGMYLLTGERKYLALAWKLARFVLIALLLIGLLYVLERYALVGWRIFA